MGFEETGLEKAVPASANHRQIKESNPKAHRFSSSDEGELELTKRLKTANSNTFANLKLACPYFKRNPEFHGTRAGACTGPGFPNVHRVKEHLYRVHKRKPHCERCFESFASDEKVGEHLRAPIVCELGEPTDPCHGFTKTQELLLHKKSQGNQRDEENWKEVYRILFPGDDESKIPSPYLTFPPSEKFLRHKSCVESIAQFAKRLEEVITEDGPPKKEISCLLQKLIPLSQQARSSLTSWNHGNQQLLQARQRATNLQIPPGTAGAVKADRSEATASKPQGDCKEGFVIEKHTDSTPGQGGQNQNQESTPGYSPLKGGVPSSFSAPTRNNRFATNMQANSSCNEFSDNSAPSALTWASALPASAITTESETVVSTNPFLSQPPWSHRGPSGPWPYIFEDYTKFDLDTLWTLNEPQ